MKKGLIAVILICTMAAAAAGCSSSGALSPDAFAKAMEEYDIDEYDDVSEFIDDLDNDRLVKAGMYVRTEDKEIRKVMLSDEINKLTEDAGEYIMQDLYSKKVQQGAVFVERTASDGTEWFIAGVSLKFDSADEADGYYEEQTGIYSDAEDVTTAEAGDIRYTFINVFEPRKAVVRAFYIEKDCVLSLTGYEKRTNSMTESMAELCGYMDIPAPDLGDWDCTVPPKYDNRVLAAKDCYDNVVVIDPDKFDKIDNQMPAVYYSSGTDMDSFTYDAMTLKGIIKDGCIFYDHLMNYTNISSTGTSSSGGGYLVLGFQFKDDVFAEDCFDQFIDLTRKDEKKYIANDTTGEEGSISYYVASLNFPVGKYEYRYYLEGDRIYMVMLAGKDIDDLDRIRSEILGNMGL